MKSRRGDRPFQGVQEKEPVRSLAIPDDPKRSGLRDHFMVSGVDMEGGVMFGSHPGKRIIAIAAIFRNFPEPHPAE